MEKLLIIGGVPLSGQVRVAGAKNAVLPILAASLLAESPVEISNVPHLNDVTTMVTLLTQLGASVLLDDSMHLHIDASKLSSTIASYELVKTMRASILVLGPLLARYGSARVAFPGGCAIGSRPLDLHISSLRALGATIEVENGYLQASMEGRLQGTCIDLPSVTVTGTENILMAAVLAEGVTTINNAALEPEVSDLAMFLNKLGAKITGIGTSSLKIEGVESLNNPGVAYSVMPDRIEAGTYLVAACMTQGSIKVMNVNPEHMTAILDALKETGAKLTIAGDSIALDMRGVRPKALSITTAPYPGMPTDMQAQFMALNTVASGKSTVTETVFENRLMHVPELKRMGALLTELSSNSIGTEGIERLSAAPVLATDLRASAGLLLAALNAEGETCIDGVYHIDRGYECVDEKLQALGAQISRVSG